MHQLLLIQLTLQILATKLFFIRRTRRAKSNSSRIKVKKMVFSTISDYALGVKRLFVRVKTAKLLGIMKNNYVSININKADICIASQFLFS